MKKLRIAQVAPLFESVPPKLYGGTERVVSFLTEALVDAGHDVTLFASGDSETRAHLIAVCRNSLRLDPNCIDHLAHQIIQLQLVQNHLDDFDIVHYHIDYLHFPFSQNFETPHVTTLHGRLDIPDLQPLYNLNRKPALVSISDSQREPLPQVNWVGTVHHGLPVDLFSPRYDRGKYLAVLGRVSPEKGVDEAIAIAIACGIPLRIAAKVDKGDQEYFDRKVKPWIEHPLIEFIGEIGEPDKQDFLGGAMALLFPIDWAEPFGLVMIEAMACGTPVVAYRRGSVPEIIEHGTNGFIAADRKNAVELVRRISEIDRRNCRKTFEERFTAARMARDYVEIFNRIIAVREPGVHLKLMES